MVSLITLLFVFVVSNQVLAVNLSKNNLFVKNTDIIFVDDDNTEGPWDGSIYHPFKNISSAVNIVKNGDIVYVLNGTYYEQFVIDKTIYLLGEDKENVVIDAEYNEHAIEISADSVKIEQFTIINSGGYKGDSGIKIQSENCEINDCIFYRHRIAVHILEGDNNRIFNCIFHTNGGGVFTEYTTTSEIKDCEFAYNGIGAHYDHCNNMIFTDSYSHENAIPILYNDSSNIVIRDSAICDNNDNGGGVFVYHSKDVTVDNCNLFHSGSGFKIVNSTDLYFTNSDIQYITHFAFWIWDESEDINISNCNVINNFRHALYLTDSYCTVTNSNLYDNHIESAFSRNSCINAKNNWWGSRYGPLFSKGFRLIDRFSSDSGRITYLPWSTKEFENTGSNWTVQDRFEKTKISGYGDEPIQLTGDDTDSDGVPDWWEEKWGYSIIEWNDHLNLDPDGDALNNFEECYTDSYGSNPFEKDVFLEFDWTISDVEGASNKPPEEYINEVKQRFKEHDINLHVDLGELEGGQELSNISDFEFDKLRNLYWDYFLDNDLNNPRKNIFHYGLVCDVGPGNGFMFTGWAHLNAFCISAQLLADQNSNKDRGFLITAGSMHELGHTLGIIADDFEGVDNHATIYPKYLEFWKYISYQSVMNYQFTYYKLQYSDGAKGKNNFDDWGNMQFDFFKNTDLSDY